LLMYHLNGFDMRNAHHQVSSGRPVVVPRPHARVLSRTLIAVVIAAGHVFVGLLWYMNPIHMRAQSTGNSPMYAEFISDAPQVETTYRVAPIEDAQSIEMPWPELPEAAIAAINEETAVDVPRIDPLNGPDVTQYSARAHLPAGKIATVILNVSIGADGAVLTAEVVRSNGDESANAAAMDYARATRWIPGMVGGVPRPMPASLTVILGESA
jgi:TonB family protein